MTQESQIYGVQQEKIYTNFCGCVQELVDIQNQSAFDQHAEFAITELRQVL